MMFRKNKALEKAQANVLPEGCLGRVGTARVNGESSRNRDYRVITQLGCPGLLDGIVEVRTSDYVEPEYERNFRKNDIDAIKKSAAHILDACSSCPLGSAGQLREEARMRLASEDELAQKLKLAQLEHDTAALMKEAAADKLAALQLQQQLPQNPH